jgi:hypothetical protein
MQEILLFGAALGVLWLWRDSTRAREVATAAAQRACKQINVQFLDGTVMLTKLRLCRRNSGTVALCRLYSFDFSLDGEQRRSGTIKMKSQLIEDLMLDIDQASVLQ